MNKWVLSTGGKILDQKWADDLKERDICANIFPIIPTNIIITIPSPALPSHLSNFLRFEYCFFSFPLVFFPIPIGTGNRTFNKYCFTMLC